MKKIFAAILVLAFALTMSGCVKITYWDGLSKSEAREFVEKTLEEKYGEEFVVVSMGTQSGETYTKLVGTCSPKSDKEILFKFESNHFGERRVYDDYIQNVVRKQVKQNIDDVLSKYYDNFASEVYVTPTTVFYDSGIRSANEATIKSFSESFTNNENNLTWVWIVLNDKEMEENVDKLKDIVQNMMRDFYSLEVFLDFIYANDDIISLCKESSKGTNSNRWDVDSIVKQNNSGMVMFAVFNDERGLFYRGKTY